MAYIVLNFKNFEFKTIVNKELTRITDLVNEKVNLIGSNRMGDIMHQGKGKIEADYCESDHVVDIMTNLLFDGNDELRSEVSLVAKTELERKHEIASLDVLQVKILNLNIPDADPNQFQIKASFFNELLISDTITSNPELVVEKEILKGELNYDPSNYEELGLFVDTPLTVSIEPIKTQSYVKQKIGKVPHNNAYSCNVDIQSVFTNTDTIKIKKRMQPTVLQSVLYAKSWNNLPLITMEIKVQRNEKNDRHHKILRDANLMKLTLVGYYNMKMPFDVASTYTSATKLPICNEKDSRIVMFNNGSKVPKRFNNTSFLPHWESLRADENNFSKDDEKCNCNLEEIYNKEIFDMDYYINKFPDHSTIWASFHRTLIVIHLSEWFSDQLRLYKWPLEIQEHRETDTLNFMACLDLSKLLYPGENTVQLVVPLQWMNAEIMMEKCGCEYLLAPNEKTSGIVTAKKSSKATTESVHTNTAATFATPTGSDDNDAFVLVEVKLLRPLKKPFIPQHISTPDLNEMLLNMELQKRKRDCRGRSHKDEHWQETVLQAAALLRTLPYNGLSDICALTRQLSVTKTRVELETSFWQEAAHYVNNNFVLNDFLKTDETFEELIMMTHACLMRSAKETLLGSAPTYDSRCTLRAARQARQLQDIPHAIKLYLHAILLKKRDSDTWRELSSCFKDVDKELANVCLNKAINLNPRHPLSLISKACLVMDDDPEDAEPFFLASLALYPFWVPLWVAASAYYFHRELYDTSNQIMDYIKGVIAEGVSEPMKFPRAWNYELGDWWDQTPLLPGTSLYYDAADLLLRIRGISLAEVCLARSLSEVGETPMYYHLLALCRRLRGDVEGTLCHLQKAKEKFPLIIYLKSLEAECHYRKGNLSDAKECFEKSVYCSGPFMTLLSLSSSLLKYNHEQTSNVLKDLLRRQPSAYAWMTFAEFWLGKVSSVGESGDGSTSEEQNLAITYAIACAEQALKWDRCCGYAWAVLAKLVRPSARRLYCQNMTGLCDYRFNEEEVENSSDSEQSFCHQFGRTINECRCRFH